MVCAQSFTPTRRPPFQRLRPCPAPVALTRPCPLAHTPSPTPPPLQVAIISGGRLCAHGSPLQLKERYGGGYTLTLTRSPDAGWDPSPLAAVVCGSVGGAYLLRHAAGEVVFKLPLEATHQFPG